MTSNNEINMHWKTLHCYKVKSLHCYELEVIALLQICNYILLYNFDNLQFSILLTICISVLSKACRRTEQDHHLLLWHERTWSWSCWCHVWSGFGVKSPLRRKIVTDDFVFNSAKELVLFLKSYSEVLCNDTSSTSWWG